MAKFNISVELDWLEGDCSLDQEIRREVINNIQDQLSKPILDKVNKNTDSMIKSKIELLVSGAIEDRIKAFMSTPRNITDKYGEVQRENVTIEDLLKEQLEDWVDKKVYDERGNRGSYNKKYSKLEYFVIKHLSNLESLVDSKIAKVVKETERDIEALVTNKIKTEVADKLTNLIVENSTALALKTED